MINRDPKCVFVAANSAEAAVGANRLEHEGVPAQVMDRMSLGGLDGLRTCFRTGKRVGYALA
jgi:hypothetical protein